MSKIDLIFPWVFGAVLVLFLVFFALPWAMEEPIYCGHRPCAEIQK